MTTKQRKKSHNRRKTIKRRSNNNMKNKIVKTFIEMLNVIKLYHWKTRSFAEHKATDELYEKLNTHVDKFVEVLLGKTRSRIHMVSLRIDLIEAENTKDITKKIHEYRDFMYDMSRTLDSKTDSDLLNIRDEILSDLSQFLYFLTFT